LQQALVDQRPEAAELVGSAQCLYCCKRAATDADCQLTQEHLFGRLEEIETPGDRVSQGLLTWGLVARAIR